MEKKTIHCKFCGKEDKNYAGYCQKCYNYFCVSGYKTYDAEYGKICKVDDINDKQYGMVICHICHRAFTKLQSHVYYAHNLSKKEYCKQFGLDNNSRLTEETYNKKMSDLAYKYDMDKQVVRVGNKTRFQQGHNGSYERSYMTQQRLKQQSFIKNKI